MSRVRFIFGTICVAMSIVLWYTHPVSATEFKEYWKATYFRVVKATRFGETSGNLCLGPATWAVHGTVGAASFTETWRVGTYERDKYAIDDYTTHKDESGWETSGKLLNQQVNVMYSFSEPQDCKDDRSNDTAHIKMNPTGVYGGLVTNNDDQGLDSWSVQDDLLGLRSMPKKWTIQGEITQAP